MRVKFHKEIEFFIKKYFISESYLLKKRILRSLKKKDEEELTILDKIIPKDSDSVDVGVYRGVYSYRLSNFSKHVYGFEPNPLIFNFLKKNLTKIINNLTLYNYALSDKTTSTLLKIPRRFKNSNKSNYEEFYKLGCATIHQKNNLHDEFDNFQVKSIKLDDILIKNNIGFIKIDVEGHEKNVLLGSVNIINKFKPNLLVEIEERHSQESVLDTINFINSLGYKSYYFDGQNLNSTSKLSNLNLKNNYIFLR